MSQANPFAARLIEASASGLAAMSAARMFELDPDLEQRFAPKAFASWKDSLTRRLGDLALALAEGQPGPFRDQVDWTRAAFVARGVPVADLRRSLDCMREVLLAELPPPTHTSIVACLDDAEAALDAAEAAPPQRLSVDTPEHHRAALYLEALLEGDRCAAAEVVLGAVRRGELGVSEAILEVLVPAQRELGRMWHLNEVGVAAEHLGTSTTRLVLHQLLGQHPTSERVGRAVMIAAVAGDAHDVGLSVVAALFELDGWRVIDLGADVPAEDLASAVADFKPDLVALAATLDVHRKELKDAIARIREQQRVLGVPAGVLVGGLAFARDEACWRSTGADAYAACANEAVAVGRRLVGLPDGLN